MTPLVLAAALSMLAPTPYAALSTPNPATVADYLALCQTNAKACSDTLFDWAWESSVGSQKVPYCLPQDEASTQAVTDKVTAWLAARPELAATPTKPALTKALTANYPCR